MEHYKFVSNRACEYFPCHEGIAPEQFNCLFCYCPLYALGDRCGGDYTYTSDGIKDCSFCLIPHRPEGYDRIVAGCGALVEETRQAHGQKETVK